MVGICYRLLDSEKKVDETVFGQLKEALQLPILVTHERLQPLWYALEEEYGWAQTIQETSTVR